MKHFFRQWPATDQNWRKNVRMAKGKEAPKEFFAPNLLHNISLFLNSPILLSKKLCVMNNCIMVHLKNAQPFFLAFSFISEGASYCSCKVDSRYILIKVRNKIKWGSFGIWFASIFTWFWCYHKHAVWYPKCESSWEEIQNFYASVDSFIGTMGIVVSPLSLVMLVLLCCQEWPFSPTYFPSNCHHRTNLWNKGYAAFLVQYIPSCDKCYPSHIHLVQHIIS